MLGFPLSFSAQTAPTVKELIDAAMTKRVKLGLPALPTKEHP